MQINQMTGEVIDELAPIRKRLEDLNGEEWYGKKQDSIWDSADILVTLDGEEYVIAEHVSDPVAAEFIAHAPEDMRVLLGRVEALEAFLKGKREQMDQARREQKYEYSRGRIMDGMSYERHGDRLEAQVKELEGIFDV